MFDGNQQNKFSNCGVGVLIASVRRGQLLEQETPVRISTTRADDLFCPFFLRLPFFFCQNYVPPFFSSLRDGRTLPPLKVQGKNRRSLNGGASGDEPFCVTTDQSRMARAGRHFPALVYYQILSGKKIVFVCEKLVHFSPPYI